MGEYTIRSFLYYLKKMSDIGEMPMIIHRGEKINMDNMTSFNVSWSYGDGAIITTEKE